MGVFCVRLTSVTLKQYTQVSDQTFGLPSGTCILAGPVLEVTAFCRFLSVRRGLPGFYPELLFLGAFAKLRKATI